jgi:hypothetical protein
MKAIYFTASIVATSIIGLSGCANNPSVPTADMTLSGTVENVGKMAPHKTDIQLKVQSDALYILFPKLQNNTGENFAAVPCEATFEYVKSGEDTLTNTQTHLYKGTFKANNNCALFTEQPSITYDLPNYMQYARLTNSESGWIFELSKDMAGEDLIIKGSLQ